MIGVVFLFWHVRFPPIQFIHFHRNAEDDNDRLARQVLETQRRTGASPADGNAGSDDARVLKLKGMLVIAAQREADLVTKHTQQEKQWQVMYKQWMQEMESKIMAMAMGGGGRGSGGAGGGSRLPGPRGW